MRTVDLDHLGLRDGDIVLDIGCGQGRHLHALYYAKRLHAVGIDPSIADLRETRRGFGKIPDIETNSRRKFSLAGASALQLPFSDASFDAVICSEVLEHISDYQTALDEIRRVLKANGYLAVSVPRRWPEWICWQLSPNGYAKDPGGHIRIFNADGLRRDIERRGLRLLRKHWAHSLHAPYWWLQCALWDRRNDSNLVRLYHRFLVWDILAQPRLTRWLDQLLNPIMGKSVVMYFVRPRSSQVESTGDVNLGLNIS